MPLDAAVIMEYAAERLSEGPMESENGIWPTVRAAGVNRNRCAARRACWSRIGGRAARLRHELDHAAAETSDRARGVSAAQLSFRGRLFGTPSFLGRLAAASGESGQLRGSHDPGGSRVRGVRHEDRAAVGAARAAQSAWKAAAPCCSQPARTAKKSPRTTTSRVGLRLLRGSIPFPPLRGARACRCRNGEAGCCEE